MSEYVWTPDKENTFFEIVRTSGSFPAGTASIFVPLHERIGVKLFDSQEARDYSLHKQQSALTLDAAPRTGNSFKIEYTNLFDGRPNVADARSVRRTLYGYITQRAKTGGQYTEEEKRSIVDKLRQIGGPTSYDMNDENFGTIDGKLVCIDFDEGSMMEMGPSGVTTYDD
jgi:hypothetical protein